MELKIGFTAFWGNAENFFHEAVLDPLQEWGYDVKHIDPSSGECDLLFVSVFGGACIKGSPTIIHYSGEHKDRCRGNEHLAKYSLGFGLDTDTNLYYPLFQIQCNRLQHRAENLDVPKTKFCSFIVSNAGDGRMCRERIEVRDFINQCKPVEGYGRVCNTGHKLEYGDYHTPASCKFNICYENTASSGDYRYITEKIIHAFAYNSIPVYKGCENVGEYFNPDAFIDCHNKSNEEILAEIEELDRNDKLYQEKLHEPVFRDIENMDQYRKERFCRFIDKVL